MHNLVLKTRDKRKNDDVLSVLACMAFGGRKDIQVSHTDSILVILISYKRPSQCFCT